MKTDGHGGRAVGNFKKIASQAWGDSIILSLHNRDEVHMALDCFTPQIEQIEKTCTKINAYF
jgi:hypothetical protein